MAENTNIQWTDHTFNPWIGCSRVHTGCKNCYAESDMDKRRGRAKWGPNGTRSLTKTWGDPVKWNKAAGRVLCEFEMDVAQNSITYREHRPRVFCASLADIFEDWQGPMVDHEGKHLVWGTDGPIPEDHEQAESCSGFTMSDARKRLFHLIDDTPNLDWLLLTKRPENIRRMWADVPDMRPIFPGAPGKLGEPQPCLVQQGKRSNVWLGTSVSDQETADAAIPELLGCRHLAPGLFLSVEPLVGPVDLTRVLLKESDATERGKPDVTFDALRGWWREGSSNRAAVDWVIVGGESGPGARPCNLEWIRDLVRQCKDAGVPCFTKQLGSKHVAYDPEKDDVCQVPLEDRKGGDPSEWPEDIRVQEFPAVAVK